MAIRIIDAPLIHNRTFNFTLSLDYRTISGGTNLYSEESFLIGPIPVWVASISIHAVRSEMQLWEAFIDSLRGRSGAARIKVPFHWVEPMLTRLGARVPDATTSLGGIPYSDGTTHSDGTGFAWSPPELSLLNSAIPMATSITLDFGIYALGLRPGDRIGVAGNLYRVESAIAASATTMTIGINPPIRKPIPAGAKISLCPTFVARVETDKDGWLTKTVQPVSQPTISFIEIPELI